MKTILLIITSLGWIASLVWASVQDIQCRKITNKTVCLVLLCSAVGTVLQSKLQLSIMMPGAAGSRTRIGSMIGALWLSHLLSALLLSVPMLLADIWRPGSFGGADIKFAFAGALMLRFQDGLEAFYVSFLLAAVMIIWWRRKRKSSFPLAPCLAIGMGYGLIRTLMHILS